LTAAIVENEADVEPLPMGQTVFAGLVHYVDYGTEWIPEGNTLWPFVHKRQSFEFEHELRAVIQAWPVVADPDAEGGQRVDLEQPSPMGRSVQVDLTALIDAIYISPVAPGWFSDLVQSVCAMYELEMRVVPSTLAARPVY